MAREHWPDLNEQLVHHGRESQPYKLRPQSYIDYSFVTRDHQNVTSMLIDAMYRVSDSIYNAFQLRGVLRGLELFPRGKILGQFEDENGSVD